MNQHFSNRCWEHFDTDEHGSVWWENWRYDCDVGEHRGDVYEEQRAEGVLVIQGLSTNSSKTPFASEDDNGLLWLLCYSSNLQSVDKDLSLKVCLAYWDLRLIN